MEARGHIKHVFPGGNTCLGFYSFYDYILSQDEAKKIIVLKGGPGVGKSNFMRKIGEDFLALNYDVEFMHCSSDNNSLDGVVIPKIKVALIDGTAPHIVDPKNPGCVDEIIHLGDFWEESGISKYKNEILETNREIGRTFNRAYKYLKSAKSIYDDNCVILSQAIDYSKVNKKTQELIERVFDGLYINDKIGKIRHLFASAITPEGLRNHIDSIIYNTKNVFILKGDHNTGKSSMLSKIIDCAATKGLNIEAYHCAFNPEKIEHVLIPQLDTIFVTSNEYHNVYKTNGEEIIDLNEYVSEIEMKKYTTELSFNKNIFNELLNQAISTISNAKRLHDLLETYFIPNMNFQKVDQKRLETVERIKKYI